MTVHSFCTIIILVSSSVFSEEVISGIVRDSVLNLPLPSVKVKISNPPCSVYTDLGGKFSLSIPGLVSVRPSRSSGNIRLDLGDRQKVKTFDFRGILLDNHQGSGVRVFIASEYRAVTAIVMSGRHSAVFVPTSSKDPSGLMKTAQNKASYQVAFLKDGYDPLLKNLISDKENEVKLLPLSSSVNISISTDSTSTLFLTTEIEEE